VQTVRFHQSCYQKTLTIFSDISNF